MYTYSTIKKVIKHMPKSCYLFRVSYYISFFISCNFCSTKFNVGQFIFGDLGVFIYMCFCEMDYNQNVEKK